MTSVEAALAGSSIAGPSSRPDDGIHRCTFDGCNKSYTKASKLAQHIRSHTGERPFVCDHDGCGASYMRNEHLKAHQRRHQDPSEKPFACEAEACELKFWTASQLKNHVQACHADHLSTATGTSSQDYPCTEPGCDMTFHKRKQLRLHIRDHHASSEAAQQLAASVDARQSAEDAPSTAALLFACQYPGCDKCFPTNSKRKAHYRTHEDGRYTCSMDHSHPQEGSDKEESPFIYTFTTWSALQAHMKEAHPPVCPWPGCGKQFQRPDNLRAHYRRHESRKLRLELEAKVMEGSHEHDLNHLRADLSDDSHEAESESEDEDEADQAPLSRRSSQGWDTQRYAPFQEDQAASATQQSVDRTSLTEDQLVRRAAQLHATRPRRGGVFRDLSSPALSIVSSLSGKTGSARLGSISTSVTSPQDSSSAFSCTWNGCSKAFTRKSTLSIHVRTAHLGERPFECSDCGRRFAHKHLVSRHRRICSGAPSSPEQTGAVNSGGSRLRFSTLVDNVLEEDRKESCSGRLTPTETASDQDTSQPSSEAESGDEQSPEQAPLAAIVAEPNDTSIKPRLLDLLTGRGYTASHSENNITTGKRPPSENGDAPTKRRRTTRDRIFACPWTNIRHELDRQMLDPALRSVDSPDTSAVQAADDAGVTPACEHRFKRLYDLRRHLRSQHGLDLTTDELSAITNRTAWTSVH